MRSALPFAATRLAPSPTGALHLGHARTFLVTWWLARQAGAKIFMRMEDLDAGRATPHSVQQAYDDLQWLGMDWDAYAGQRSVVQSSRLPAYQAALETLWERGAIYPCTCTRAEIAAGVIASANAPHEQDAGTNARYPGICRPTPGPDTPPRPPIAQVMREVFDRTGKSICWRLRVSDGPIPFHDQIAGEQVFDIAAETGDFPLTRFATPDAAIPPAYQLACVVDDHAMGIDMVIRGDDLLSSTPRQMLVYRALGWTPPRFAHVPLVIGADGKRLAKRHGESRIDQFRAAGLSPERIVGWAAWRCGQCDAPREVSASDMTARFDLSKLPRSRLVLSDEDRTWLTA